MADRPRNKKKYKAGQPPKAPKPRTDSHGFPLFSEASTVSAYLYGTRPYPYNPDDIIGRKGLKKYSEMARDEQVKAAMMAKQFSVIAPGWEVEPAEHEKAGEKKDAEEVSDFLEQVLNDMEGSFDTKLIEMLSALTYGYSVAEKIFKLIDYGDFKGLIGLSDLKFRNPEGIEFDTDAYGNMYPDGVLQAKNRMPANKFLIYSYRKKFSNYYGDADLRECYRAWWAKDNVIKFMMITLERYGEPTWVFNAAGGLSMETKGLLENFMRDIQSKSGLILPDTITADPKSPGNDAGRTYIPVLEYLDGLIRGALGMPNLIGASTSESQTGSFARSDTQMDMWLTLMEYIRHDVEANLNEQIIKPLVDWNFDVTDGKYPVFRFKALSEEQKQAQFDTYMKGLTSHAMTKTRDDENFFRERLEVPLLPDDYPVTGEVTPEMQQQQDQQAQEMHDATISTMQAKAENGGAGSPAPAGGFPPKTAKASEEQQLELYINTKHRPPGDEHGGEFAPGGASEMADKVMKDYGFEEKARSFVKNSDTWLKGIDIGPCGAIASAAATALRRKGLDAKSFSAQYETGTDWGGAPHYAVMVYKNKQPAFIVDLSVAQFDSKAPNLVLPSDAAWKKYTDIQENDDPALDIGTPAGLWTKKDIALWKKRLAL